MSEQGGYTRVELMFRLDAALKRIEALEAALRDVIILTESEEGGSAWDVINVAHAALAPEQDK